MSKPSFLMPASGRTGGVARKSDTESRLAKAVASPDHPQPVARLGDRRDIDKHTGMTSAPTAPPVPDDTPNTEV
jgi:hypothetical protein